VQQKQSEIMDVDPFAVSEAMNRHGVLQLIHGHTHRPAIHRFLMDGEAACRIVLGDWYERDSVLACDGQGPQLLSVAALH
jgi:UDP-2,3-diacylglucosamine hydrolase